MSDEHSGLGEGHPHVEADAVCEQCDTVNPPGSLLCKACGNNLRDQLLSREIGEGPYDAVIEPTVQPRRVLAGLLGIFGLLVILWTAWNVDRIESMVAEGFTSPESGAIASYWSAPRSGVYEELLRELDRTPIRPEEVASALAAQPAEEFLDGRYVLREDSSENANTIGEAYCRMAGETVYFVARLHQGTVEVRGRARLEGTDLLEAALIGAQSDDSYGEGKGIAERDDDGGFACYGTSMDGVNRYQVAAYRIP
jgi:hypothetical protein